MFGDDKTRPRTLDANSVWMKFWFTTFDGGRCAGDRYKISRYDSSIHKFCRSVGRIMLDFRELREPETSMNAPERATLDRTEVGN